MNSQFFYYLNGLAGKSVNFDTLVVFFAAYLQYWLVAGLLLFLWLGKDKKQELKNLLLVGLSALLSRGIITEIIRFFYPVSRPFVDNDVYLLLSHSASNSFPSGHASFFFALAAAVFFFNKRWSVVLFAGAILISLSRVIAGIHWPADILAGVAVGIFSAWLVRLGVEKYTKLS